MFKRLFLAAALSLSLAACGHVQVKYVTVRQYVPVQIPSDFTTPVDVPKKKGGWTVDDMQGDAVGNYVSDLRYTIKEANRRIDNTRTLLESYNSDVEKLNQEAQKAAEQEAKKK